MLVYSGENGAVSEFGVGVPYQKCREEGVPNDRWPTLSNLL